MDDPFRPPEPVVVTPPARPHFVWSLPISGAIHLFVLTFVVVLAMRNVRGCGILIAPAGGMDGENGHSGSGGTEVNVSLEAPPAERLGAGRPASPAAPPPAAPAPATPPPPTPTPATGTATAPHHPVLRAHTPTPDPEPAEAPPPAPAAPRTNANAHATNTPSPAASTPSEAVPGANGGGTGDWMRNSGLRPGSIGSQRALLPRAVHCNDEVAGVWRAQKYDPAYGDWMLATLYVHRTEGNALRGTMVVHQWDGGPFDVRPPMCGPDGFDFIVDEPSVGFARDHYLDFGSDSWRMREMRCNANMRPISYRPDHFTGTIDLGREEFQSVNNDGGRAVNDPMVFRRIQCVDEAAADGGVSGAPP